MRPLTFKIGFILLCIFSFSVLAMAQGRGSESGVAGQKADPNNRSINITYKPIPELTQAARDRHVKGTVRLRATFLATGKMGDVEFVSDDPVNTMDSVGLVKSSIKAARKIKFQPALKDGKAITVVKIVEFYFSAL